MSKNISWYKTFLSLAALIAGGLAVGCDIALEKIHLQGVDPAELETIGSGHWMYLLSGLSRVAVLAIALSLFAMWLGRIRFQRAFTISGLSMLPLLVLLLRTLDERYFLTSPVSWLRVIAYLGVLGLFWWFVTHSLTIRPLTTPGKWMMTGLVFLISAGWATGWFGDRRLPVGDEPSYLMITHSIAQDQDINLDDDYRVQEYRRFYSGRYPSFTHLGYNGVNYPHHSIGLPLFLAPVYGLVLASGMEAWIVLIMRLCMAVIYGLCTLMTWTLIKQITGKVQIANWCIAAFFLSGPLLFFSLEIYPETFVAFLLVSSVYALFYPENASRTARFFWVVAAASYLPWLGIKYISTGIVLFIIAIYHVMKQKGHRERTILIICIPAVLSFVAYACFLYGHYRNFDPTSIYTGVIPGTGIRNVLPGEPGFIESIPEHLSFIGPFIWGIFIEQRVGILLFAPLYLLLLPGLIEGFSRNRKVASALVLLTASHVGIYAWHNNWSGYCPPNRQIIAVAPLLIVICAWGWDAARSTFSIWFKRLAMLWGWGVVWLLLVNERWIYHTMNPHLSGGEANVLRAFSPDFSLDLPAVFPLLMGSIKHTKANIIWSVFFVIIAVILCFGRSRDRRDPVITPGFFLAVLAIVLPLGLGLFWYITPPGSFSVEFENQPVKRIIILDNNHLGTELEGFWIRGRAAARLILGFHDPKPTLTADFYSLVPNTVTIDAGGRNRTMIMDGKNHAVFTIKPRRLFQRGDWYYVKTKIHASDGVSPQILTGSSDTRFLGVFTKLK
jgi:hypothetical protein